MEATKKATIVDVAREAGVSVATVSRVVNGNYPVKSETKERVQRAIDALQYVPNVQARELNMQRSSTIGVVVPGLYNMFFAEVIDGIEKNMRKKGFSLLLNCAQNDPDLEMECIKTLVSRNVSGIIVISPNTQGMHETFYRQLIKRVPLVFINGYRRIPNVSYVTNDEALGTQQALEYLMSLGHQRILFVRGEHSDSYTVKENAYRSFLTEKGCFHQEDIIDIGEGNSIETVASARDRLLDVLPATQATAVFCCNDLMATGAIKACKERSLRVPQDMSVIGYDNITLASLIEPQITTMDQNMFQLGSNAADVLVEMIHGGKSKRITLENTLIVRESTGPKA